MQIEQFVIDFVCLLSSMPKTGIFHAVLQMLCHGQNCEFCHMEFCGKINVTSLIKLQLTSFFLHIEPIHVVFISALQFLKISYKMAPFFLTHPVV